MRPGWLLEEVMSPWVLKVMWKFLVGRWVRWALKAILNRTISSSKGSFKWASRTFTRTPATLSSLILLYILCRIDQETETSRVQVICPTSLSREVTECGLRNCTSFFKFYAISTHHTDYLANDSGIKALWKCRLIHLFTILTKDAGVHGRTNLLTFGNTGPRQYNFLILLKSN